MGTAYDYDLVVIGAGSGGTRTARWSASLGAKVAICEEYRYGGTCVVRGCIPKKLLAYASELNAELTTAQNYGQRLERGAFDWVQCKVHRDREVAHLSALYRDMLLKQGVVLKPGKGRVTGPHTVEVCGESLSAERILVATGCEPSLTNFPGHQWAITSNQIFAWEHLPRSLLVVGGGFIAVEMASILNGLGVEVEMVIRGEHILRGFDQELAVFLAQELAKKGVVLSPQCQVKALKKRIRQFTRGSIKRRHHSTSGANSLGYWSGAKNLGTRAFSGGSEIGCSGRGFGGSAFLLVCPLNLRRGRLY